MSKFGKFDEKETKEGNIRRVFSRCMEMMRRAGVAFCEDEKIEELKKITAKHLTDEQARSLLNIANLEDEDKFYFLNDSDAEEKFLKRFYYNVLPTVMMEYSAFNKARSDFLRYVLVEFNRNYAKNINDFNNVSSLYDFAADEIQRLHWEQVDYDPLFREMLNGRTLCFFEVLPLLFNDTEFFEAALGLETLTLSTISDILYALERVHLLGVMEIINAPEKHVYTIFEPGVRAKMAKILLANKKVKKFLDEGGDVLRDWDFVKTHKAIASFVIKFEPESRLPFVRRVAERDINKIEDLENACYFASGVANVLLTMVRECCGEEAVDYEAKKIVLEVFLHYKIVEKEWFKNLPEIFQQIVIVEQARVIFDKAEIVVLSVLPETDIDKNTLKKEVDDFMNALKKIAKSGGKPSAYYANEPFYSDEIPDTESYLTSLIFDVSVTFLKDSFDPWKAVKPVLGIFRNFNEQTYSIDMKYYDYSRFEWAFVPLRLTPLLGSLEGEEAAKVCEEWFKYLAGELKSADDFAINKRKENPENVPEEFKEGYDINVIEPHPLWREAYCEAAGDLRVNLGCKSVFNHLKKNDIDKDVREAAAKTLERIGKIKGKFDSGSRKRALLNAWWWYRVAHLKSLGIDFDWVAAQNLKSKEVKVNYPKKY